MPYTLGRFPHSPLRTALWQRSQSQMPKILVTESGSPLQVSVRMGWGPIHHPPWGHRAAALSEDGLSGLQKWSHTPAVVPQYSLTYPIGRGRGQRRWILPLLPTDLGVQATCIGSSLKRGVGLGQKLRYCPWDRWSGGRASDMCRSVLRNCTLYFTSFNPSGYSSYPLLWPLFRTEY